MRDGNCPHCEDKTVFRIIQREILLILLLSILAVPMFFFTRAIAARNRAVETSIAAAWYQRGQQAAEKGDTKAAVDAFRQAAVHNPGNTQYSLALATVLTGSNQDDEAHQLLLRLREESPESSEINLQLARLMAKRQDVTSAIRYYQHALYGKWSTENADSQRLWMHIEFARFLLQHQERTTALAELLTLNAFLPETADAHIESGRLFLQAGDAREALKHFTRAIRLDAKSAEARAGAGEAAFALANYGAARRYLRTAVERDSNLGNAFTLLNLTGLIMDYDPLLPRLPEDERSRRFIAGFNHATGRLRSCMANRPDMFTALWNEAQAMKPRFRLQALRHDSELLSSGVDLIFRIESAMQGGCGDSTALDQALILIGSKHGGETEP